MLIRSIRLVLRHAVTEARAHRGILLAFVVLICAAALLANSGWYRFLHPNSVGLIAAVVFGLLLADRPGTRNTLNQRLPGGVIHAWAGRLVALFGIVCGLAALRLGLEVALSMFDRGSLQVDYALQAFRRLNPETMAALTLGFWLFTLAGICRSRPLTGLLGAVTTYVLLLPVMWLLGGGQHLQWDRMKLPARESILGSEALREAALHICSNGWATAFALAACWVGRVRRLERPGESRRAFSWTMAIMLLCTMSAAAELYTRAYRLNLRAARGTTISQSAYVNPDESLAFLSTGRNSVVLDMRSGSTRLLESSVRRGRIQIPFRTSSPLRPARHVYRDVTMLAHVSFKAGSVDGWNLLDCESAEVIGHAPSRHSVSGLESRIRESRRRSSLLFLPDGRRCWFLRGALEIETATGFERVSTWKRDWRPGSSWGFLIEVRTGRELGYFDLRRMKRYVPGREWRKTFWGLRDLWLVGSPTRSVFIRYHLWDPDTKQESAAPGFSPLDEILAVLMDGRVLVRSTKPGPGYTIALIDLESGTRRPVAAPGMSRTARPRRLLPPRPGRIIIDLPEQARQETHTGSSYVSSFHPDHPGLTKPVLVFDAYSVADEDGWVYAAFHGLEKVNLVTGERIQLMRVGR